MLSMICCRHRKPASRICDLVEAAKQCPIACTSRQECYHQPDKLVSKVKFAFDSIQLITNSHPNGTVCLGKYGGTAPSSSQSRATNHTRLVSSRSNSQVCVCAYVFVHACVCHCNMAAISAQTKSNSEFVSCTVCFGILYACRHVCACM